MKNRIPYGRTFVPFLLGVALWCAGAPAVPAAAPQEQMQFADGLYARGLYDLAIKEYIQLVSSSPDFSKMDQVLYRVGECYRQLGQFAPAEMFYKRVMQTFPTSPFRFKAEFRRAELFIDNKQYADAVTLLNALAQTEPPEELAPAIQYYRGICFGRQGQVAEGRQALQEVLDRYPDSPYQSLAALELADQLRAAGRADEEKALYEKALKNPASPDIGAEAAFQLGDLAFRHQDFGESAKMYELLLKQYPRSPRLAEARRQALWSYYHIGRAADGLALADAALADGARPEPLDEWLYLQAHFNRQLLNRQAADAGYERLIREFPDSNLAPAAAYEFALMAFQAGDFRTAVERASAVRAEDDLKNDLNWLLAESYKALGDTAKAVQFYQFVVDAGEATPRAPDALYRLAILLQEREDWGQASALYRRLVDRFKDGPLTAQALLASGFCQAQLDQYREAVIDWSRLVSDCPGSPLVEEALFQKGLAEIRLNREVQARDTLKQLLDRFPGTTKRAEALFWQGTLLEQADETAAALDCYREALAQKPSVEMARNLQYRMAGLLQRQGKVEESAALLEDLLDTPARASMTPALVHWLAGYYAERKDWDRAARAATALIDRAGQDVQWRQVGQCMLGQVREEQGRIEEALRAYETVVAGGPVTREGVTALERLGRIHLREKRLADAEKAFQTASERASDPDMDDVRVRALEGLALAEEAQGKTDLALRHFLSIAILFDDPQITPASMRRAIALLKAKQRDGEAASLLEELRQRYPDAAGE